MPWLPRWLHTSVELNEDMTKENPLLMSIHPADVCRLSYFRLYYLSIKLENLVDIALSESEQLKKVWHPNFPSWPEQIVKNVLENGLGTKAKPTWERSEKFPWRRWLRLSPRFCRCRKTRSRSWLRSLWKFVMRILTMTFCGGLRRRFLKVAAVSTMNL